MRCREFEDRMNEVLDQRLARERDPLLVRHASECHSCQQLLAGQAVLFAGVELLETPPLPGQFAAAVLEKSGSHSATVNTALPGRKSRWLAIVAGLASLAAIVLVAVLIDMLSQQPQDAPVAARPAAPVATPKTVDVAKNLPPQKQPPTTAVAKAVAPPRIAPGAPSKPEYEGYRVVFDSLTAGFPTAVEEIDRVQQSTPAIRPLRASFSMAIGTLQRTIPNRTKRDSRPNKPDSGFFRYAHDVVV